MKYTVAITAMPMQANHVQCRVARLQAPDDDGDEDAQDDEGRQRDQEAVEEPGDRPWEHARIDEAVGAGHEALARQGRRYPGHGRRGLHGFVPGQVPAGAVLHQFSWLASWMSDI